MIYKTAEVREEKRAGISGQYGEGSYKGLCESTKYNYKYGGIRVDYGDVKKYGNIIGAGYEIGSSVMVLYVTSSSDTSYRLEAIMLQLDERFTGKVVTPILSFLYTNFEHYYSILTATYHYKKYSITAGGLLPLGQDEVIKLHSILGIGLYY